MSILLEIAGVRRDATIEEGAYDPQMQVWSSVAEARSLHEAVKIYGSGSTTNSGTTAAETKKFRDKDIMVSDMDGDDTST